MKTNTTTTSNLGKTPGAGSDKQHVNTPANANDRLKKGNIQQPADKQRGGTGTL